MVADRARCTVWELDDAPSWWVDRLVMALEAESRAADEVKRRRERQSRRAAAGGGR
jgi:hypothetical protein